MKKLILFAIALLLFLIVNEVYYNKEVQKLTQQVYKTKSDEIIKLFNDEVEKKFGKTFAMTYLLSKDDKLINALVKNDRSLLDYTEIINEIQKFDEYKNLWIQVIDKDGYSFYRSWTNKIGDHAASARIDIVDMINDPKPMRGISTGRFDMTFKTMIPLYDKNKFIGMIEMISKFNSIANLLKDHNIEPLMVLHEDYTKRFIKPFTGLFIGNNYVANLNASKEIMKKAKSYGLSKLMYLKEPVTLENHMVTTTQIKDVHGKEMGFFIFFFDLNNLDKSIIYNFKVEYYSKVIVLLIIIILIILYFLNRQNAKALNKEVEKQTKRIKQQQSKLESILKIYDDNVIFSRTNTKGIITYVSKAFCEISGYSKDELVGKPHSIVRHQDMSSKLFKNMWETISNGKVWKGEVKNIKKNGGYYWVYSKVEPMFDENKNIVGYVSTRTDITAKKEYEEYQLRMLNQAKMAAMGEMLANIAHQWRQPLSIITTAASGVSYKKELDMLEDDEIEKQMEHIVNSADYLSQTIETFRNFLKAKKEYKAICIQESIKSVLQILTSTIKNNQINIIDNFSSKNKIVIGMVSGELEQVLINIINNSKDAFELRDIKNRKIIIDLEERQNDIVLSIEDNAGGIPEEILPKIFDAYYTTKHESQGTGLGLNMSYRIITESLNGKLYTKNTHLGAKFFIEIPKQQKAQ